MWDELWENNKDALRKMIEDKWVFDDYKVNHPSDWNTIAEFIGETVFKYDAVGNPCGLTSSLATRIPCSAQSYVFIFGTTSENLMIRNVVIGYEDIDVIGEASDVNDVMRGAECFVRGTRKIFNN